MNTSLVVVDYGVGNVGALLNMFEYIGIDAVSSNDSSDISSAKALVLPGVGAFDRAMLRLRESSLIPALEDAVLERRAPVLGVCLGMQLLAHRSEEGVEPGLGWISAEVQRLVSDASSGLRVPHIGWSEITPSKGSRLFDTSTASPRFYFDHSYHVVCDDQQDIAATFDFGGPVCCSIQRNNIFGVQFHPEKSHRHGMRLLETFGSLVARR